MAETHPLNSIEVENFNSWLKTEQDYRVATEFAEHGWEEDQIFSKSESETLCAICRTFPRKAFVLKCGHYFCQCCLYQWFFVDEISFNSEGFITRPCPYCRRPFTRKDITCKSMSDFEHSVLIQCINDDCPLQLPPVAMRIHEGIGCTKRMIRCPSNKCGISIRAEDALNHYSNCAKREIYCDSCEMLCPVSNMEHDCIRNLKQQLHQYQKRCCVEFPLMFTQPPLIKRATVLSDHDFVTDLNDRCLSLEERNLRRFARLGRNRGISLFS